VQSEGEEFVNIIMIHSHRMQMKRLWKTLPFHGRSITRTIPCKIVGESDGINEIDDDADYKFENSNNVPKGVDKQ